MLKGCTPQTPADIFGLPGTNQTLANDDWLVKNRIKHGIDDFVNFDSCQSCVTNTKICLFNLAWFFM